ncbi:MAG: hydrogenase nickel incorporation protein HypB [Bacteroidales bacterium]|nr:hydrogenase nickel incorporation protein HypB [Bacteroidales bacterium]
MCGTCGCDSDKPVTFRKPGDVHEHEHNHSHNHSHDHDGSQHSHDHTHSHQHGHAHENEHHHHSHDHDHHHADDAHAHQHGHSHSHSHDSISEREIELSRNILSKNDLLAERNRGFFEAKNVFAINMVSSPGSGKTSLLEKTIKEIGKDLNCFVIEGDQQTMNDADRIEKAGAPVIQVNTGNGCHLDAEMINTAVKQLEVKENSVLFIENVGNLVCPAMFDLGESKRVVIISTTEGEDKPIKYPTMFETADICVINKIDLLPYLDFDIEKCKEYAMKVNHHLEFFEVSAKTGEGIDKWYNWLKNNK